MNKDNFITEVKNLNIEITDIIVEQLELYADYLLEYNKHTNLTAIRTKEEVYLKHFLDSLTITKVVDLTKEETLLDIGSGAGFPGMVLKLFFPNLKITLIDSNNKKTKFLESLKLKLNVDNLEVINDRIENVTKSRLNSYDIVTARAVTNMPVLTELAMPLVKKDKYFIAMKGSNEEEIVLGKYAILKMDGIIEDIKTFELLNAGIRNIIKVKKLKNSDIKNLRSYDKIIKRPLIKK